VSSSGGHGSQNPEPTCSTRNKANNIGEVVLSEEIDTSELQKTKSARESCSHIQHLPSDVLEQVSNGKINSDTTGTASPTSVKPHVTMSDEFQNTCTDMRDAECQTVLTGELLAGLQKRQDVGSQTIGTGDVISLNLYYGNLSGCKLVTATCDPLNEGLHSHTTLNDIKNCVDVFQGNITQLSQTVSCSVKVTNKEREVNEAKVDDAHVNDSWSHNSSPHKMTRYYTSFSHITLLYILLFFSVHCIRNAVINTSFFLYKIMSSVYNKLFE
jgi:hypothetical protein